MANVAAALTCALALLTVFSAAQARKGFWDYFSQSSGNKGRAEQTQQQKLALESPLKDSLEQDLSTMAMDTLLEKLGPLGGQGRESPGLPHDPAAVRQRLQEELQEVRTRLEPYMAEVHERVGWQLEGLRRQLLPYTVELMEQVALRVQELQEQLRLLGDDAQARLRELPGRVVAHTGRVQELVHPYAERLVSGIGRHVQELQRSVAPHAAHASPARLGRCVQALSRKLTREAQALHARIRRNLEQLRLELGAVAGAADRDPQELSDEVRRQLQAFRSDTFLQVAAFTRALDRETAQVQQQLAPPPPGHQAFAPDFPAGDGDKARRELQARLDDLWEDISYGLEDRLLPPGEP
ncbi:apolipoprotein A-V isoform X2 [Sorex fumeus]|uniref:apolipoprotein A-V isoform X2 n=1 Tax=Sorex fumeus TaxID=62283 RepID=UPI0024ADA5E5|nr:apolipoprotein A-V isoform X2 [Sorex fumeus]